MSLAEKREAAEQLRGELSALRVEKEHILHGGNADMQEQKLEDEIDRLQREVEMARAERDAAKTGGSVEDALEAMRAAAAAQSDDKIEFVESLDDITPDSTPSAEVAPVPGQLLEPPALFGPSLLTETTTDAPKADGE